MPGQGVAFLKTAHVNRWGSVTPGYKGESHELGVANSERN